VNQSTSLSIVEQSLEDILTRLQEMAPSPRVRELLQRARAFEHTVQGWATRAPTSEERAEMLKLVLELNVEVMNHGRASEPAPPPPRPANVKR
jgi:hypothetical protein